MNHNMFHNPIVQDNIEKLKHYGYEIVEPAHGMLANGDMGDGRMARESVRKSRKKKFWKAIWILFRRFMRLSSREWM